MWLGLSVISGLEFIMFLCDLANTAYLDRKDKKRRSRAQKSDFAYDPREVDNCPCECPPNGKVNQPEEDIDVQELFANAYAKKLAKTSFGKSMLEDLKAEKKKKKSSPPLQTAQSIQTSKSNRNY